MYKLKFLIILFTVHCSLFTAIAQQGGVKIINKSDKVETINGRNYYIHNVLKGQTLFSIAKAYNVTLDEITSENPEAKKAIVPDQKLKIPAKNVKKAQIKKETPPPQKKDSFNYHTVKSKETLYSIAKKYNMTEEDIRNANTDVNLNLQAGQVIKIPIKPGEKKDKKKGFFNKLFGKTTEEPVKKDTAAKIVVKKDSAAKPEKKPEADVPCREMNKSEVYKIALFLPFNFNDIDNIKTEDINDDMKLGALYKSVSLMQYYEGTLLAVDTLQKQGLNAKLFVYDINNDSVNLSNILKKPEMSSMNLMISPQLNRKFNPILTFAKKNGIKLVTNSQLIADNNIYDNLFRLTPSHALQLKQLAVYISEEYPADNVIVVYHGNNSSQKKDAELFRTALASAKKNENSCKTADLSKSNFESLRNMLSKTFNNILITFINNEVSLSEYLSHLNNIRDDYRIDLYGLQSWETFSNIETNHLQNLNLHLFSTSFIDYDKDNVRKFILRFRNDYKTEPNLYAYQGYDAAYYFMNAMMRYGKSFEKCLPSISSDMLQTKYMFQKDEHGGYENIYLNVTKYEDYKLINSRNK